MTTMNDDVNPDDEWMTELTEDQTREYEEIVAMVNELSERAIKVEYSFRGYDRKHMVEVQGAKCYGQGPKVHAFLSGAVAMSHAYEWQKALEGI